VLHSHPPLFRPSATPTPLGDARRPSSNAVAAAPFSRQHQHQQKHLKRAADAAFAPLPPLPDFDDKENVSPTAAAVLRKVGGEPPLAPSSSSPFTLAKALAAVAPPKAKRGACFDDDESKAAVAVAVAGAARQQRKRSKQQQQQQQQQLVAPAPSLLRTTATATTTASTSAAADLEGCPPLRPSSTTNLLSLLRERADSEMLRACAILSALDAKAAAEEEEARKSSKVAAAAGR
jgi:hypothetical protein